MDDENGWLCRKFRRSIVLDGVIALYERRFQDWADKYSEADEVYFPGELKYASRLFKYVNSCCEKGFVTFNPTSEVRKFVAFFNKFERE